MMSHPPHDAAAAFTVQLRWLAQHLAGENGQLPAFSGLTATHLQGRAFPDWPVVEEVLAAFEYVHGDGGPVRAHTRALYTDAWHAWRAAHLTQQPKPRPPAVPQQQTAAEPASRPAAEASEPVARRTRRPAVGRAGSSLAALAFGQAAALPHTPAPPEASDARSDAQRSELLLAQARRTAAHLRGLRQRGASGQAHALLCDAAAAPQSLPALISVLEQDAEVATLLWEVTSLPPRLLSEAVAALETGACQSHAQLVLRQAAGRPIPDLAELAATLIQTGHASPAFHLLRHLLLSRPRSDAVEAAEVQPMILPTLIAAAQSVSPECRNDLVYALRVAGLNGGS